MNELSDRNLALLTVLVALCVVLGYASSARADLTPTAGTLTDYAAGALGGDRDSDNVLDGIDRCPDEDASGMDADGDGCVDRAADLAAVVVTLDLPRATERALVASVTAAARDTGPAAVHKLGAFINRVASQRGRTIDDEQANLLMSFAAHASAVLQPAG